ncbi:MAG: hypothetical protein IH985_02295 [Planctomycetes bacterium]|nr:hypothetical protein [Planctomycetota bacterium]
MKLVLCRADRSCERTGIVLIGAAIIAIGGTAPPATAQVTQQWHAREFQDNVFGVDDAVDIAYWKDGNVEWVYVTGYQTTASGATVFATHKYDANFSGPGENEPVVSRFYPDPPASATGTNKAVAIAVDPVSGDVYFTGESIDTSGMMNGLDYVTIKYDKDLDPHDDWIMAGHPGAVVRWDNPIFAGPGSHDRPVDIALGKRFEGNPFDNVIGITGRSYGGPATKYDIVTVLMEAGTGDPWSDWGNVGWGMGARSFNGDADSNDSAAELDVIWTGDIPEAPPGVDTYVAGTTRYLHSGQPNDDIVTIKYDTAGSPAAPFGWTNVYNGPMNADDVATAMVVDFIKYKAVFVCGYTPHYVAGASASSGGGSGTGARSGGGALR